MLSSLYSAVQSRLSLAKTNFNKLGVPMAKSHSFANPSSMDCQTRFHQPLYSSIGSSSVLYPKFTYNDPVKPELESEYKYTNAWGLLVSIDAKDCDPSRIRSYSKINQYTTELCDLIKMKKFGSAKVIHFGNDSKVSGYSLSQFIETSLISGHFANTTNSSYIDIFSCKYYDPQIAAKFTADFFGAKSYNYNVLLRR